MIGRSPPEDAAAASATEWSAAIEAVRAKIGRSLLTHDDLLVLAAAAIARTYTFEEKNYSAPSAQPGR